MKLESLLSSLVLIALSGAFLGGTAFAAEDRVKASEVLPAQFFRSIHYDIADSVRRDHHFYRFRVDSDYGSFDVTSIAMLRVRLHELSVLSQLTPVLREHGFSLNRAPDGQRGVASDSVADIISNPLGTAGQLMDNFRHNFEATFTDDRKIIEPEGTLPDSNGKTTDRNPGPHKRSAAAQLGVDVYSSNKALQRALEVLGQKRSAGNLSGTIAPTELTSIKPLDFGSGVFDHRLRSQLKNEGAAAINAHVDQLLATKGISKSVRLTLLTHQNFTPRTRLYLASYLSLLRDTTHTESLIKIANSASTEADTIAFVNMARMVAFLHLSGEHVTTISLWQNYPVVTVGADLFIPLPVDHLDWSAQSDTSKVSFDSLMNHFGATRLTLLIAGTLNENSRVELSKHGIGYRERYSF